ncbi:single-strand DNA endonuclease 1 isoform X4 [Ziziphus jujuba]|uniref:Single-strand DNA endonuclease 1 isoform X4 n=1 Tax=Ziziphus jujuba TaxID=326968 RepID=A0ABM3ICL0_ZIZJJ|nr:single-strand DNA endonuclease 1 isoform X4 [Ziziphus jujuba]
MGVKNLWDIFESCKKTLPLHHLQNKRVCIDLSCWMVQLQNVSKSHCLKEKNYLKNLFHRLRALIALNCSLIFVTDGSIPAIKISTYRRRLNLPSEVSHDGINPQKVSSLRRNMGSEFSCMIKEAKLLGMALGIPCLDGIEEAEAQCALLNSEKLCDGCFTSDSDVFLFGGRTVYRDICLGDGGYVVCYEMADIEKQLGFGRNSLVLSGCLVNSHETVNTSQRDDQFLQVIDAFLNPKCHAADSDAVHRVLAQHPFQHVNLQQICGQFFEWPPEKTDKYILPKIAERDLRRFANLRSTSLELGLKLLLHEMPTKCPVSEIIKQRKVQGKECYEVSWEEMHGLKTSVVPADLLESACPEKIVEFEERRAQKKKQNHPKAKPKKSRNMSCVDDDNIYQKLQNLLLDTESGSNSAQCPLATRAVISANAMPAREANPTIRDPLVHMKLESSHHYGSSISGHEVGQSASQCEIIDLLSPSPQIRHRTVSEHENGNVQRIDVINLSDSETEMSVEHERKARDLRSFIATIKNDNS